MSEIVGIIMYFGLMALYLIAAFAAFSLICTAFDWISHRVNRFFSTTSSTDSTPDEDE